MPESQPVPEPVGQLEFEAARDAVLAVLARYAEQIDAEERRPAPDADVISRLAKERIAYGAALHELQSADAADVERIKARAYVDLARLEAGGTPH